MTILFRKRLVIVLLFGLALVGTLLLADSQTSDTSDKPRLTDYEHYIQATFNKPTFYPVQQTVPTRQYRPIDRWIGRLILPPKDLIQEQDQIWFEVYEAPAPYQSLRGQWVTLAWSAEASVQAYVKSVTVDINFNQVATKSQQDGNLHPTRLNRVNHVGPLASLAGARLANDVIVSLTGSVQAAVDPDQGDRPILWIETDPIQVTGRYYTLVKILRPVAVNSMSTSFEQTSDQFIVQHYNPASQHFDGPQEIVRIPQVPANRSGVFASTHRDIHHSPVNDQGWYLYGATDSNGLFVVQSIEPRRLLDLQPDEIILGPKAGATYIREDNWNHTETKQGTVQSVLVNPSNTTPDAALAQWKEGDRAIVMHLFGGIGGQRAEPSILGITTGHFSYGLARVVKEPISNELRFNVLYHQVYAHNPQGIIAGSSTWANYMGDLQQGWLGSRPTSDVIIKLDAITQDYDFGDIHISPLSEFERQLRMMTARYRTGDGTGAAVVTPATSCVQDSNQALYRTIKSVENQIQSHSQVQQWLDDHPDDPQHRRFEKLSALAQALERQLTPLGIVRRDWQQREEFLEGTRPEQGWGGDRNIFAALTSWRTLLPRRAHDEISQILLDHGAQLWFMRTNQVGGKNPQIAPRAPTTLLRL